MLFVCAISISVIVGCSGGGGGGEAAPAPVDTTAAAGVRRIEVARKTELPSPALFSIKFEPHGGGSGGGGMRGFMGPASGENETAYIVKKTHYNEYHFKLLKG